MIDFVRFVCVCVGESKFFFSVICAYDLSVTEFNQIFEKKKQKSNFLIGLLNYKLIIFLLLLKKKIDKIKSNSICLFC